MAIFRKVYPAYIFFRLIGRHQQDQHRYWTGRITDDGDENCEAFIKWKRTIKGPQPLRGTDVRSRQRSPMDGPLPVRKGAVDEDPWNADSGDEYDAVREGLGERDPVADDDGVMDLPETPPDREVETEPAQPAEENAIPMDLDEPKGSSAKRQKTEPQTGEDIKVLDAERIEAAVKKGGGHVRGDGVGVSESQNARTWELSAFLTIRSTCVAMDMESTNFSQKPDGTSATMSMAEFKDALKGVSSTPCLRSSAAM